jgi:hypothetical protein
MTVRESPFTVGEYVINAIYFKRGILMPEGRSASIDFRKVKEDAFSGYSYRLLSTYDRNL